MNMGIVSVEFSNRLRMNEVEYGTPDVEYALIKFRCNIGHLMFEGFEQLKKEDYYRFSSEEH